MIMTSVISSKSNGKIKFPFGQTWLLFCESVILVIFFGKIFISKAIWTIPFWKGISLKISNKTSVSVFTVKWIWLTEWIIMSKWIIICRKILVISPNAVTKSVNRQFDDSLAQGKPLNKFSNIFCVLFLRRSSILD